MGWAWCRLKEIVVINPRNKLDDNLEVSFIPMSYIEADYKNAHNQDKRIWKEIKNGFTHFAENDVAIAKISPCFENKKSVIFHNLHNGYGAGTTELFILRTSSVIIPEYLLWIVKTDAFINAGVGNFSGVVGQQRLAKDLVENYLIPLPPIGEQQRIVNSINSAFNQIDFIEDNSCDLQAAIKQAKSKILDLAIHGKLVPQDPSDEPAEELLKRLATSDNRPYEKLEEEPFEIPESWCWVKLDNLADIARGGSPRPIQDFITNDENGINWIKIGDTSEESKYITSAKEKIKPEGIKHSRFVHVGDFLLTNSMSFGRPYILKIDGCIHDGWLVFANIKDCLLQDYLYFALSSKYIYDKFSMVAAGSTVKNLKSDTVKQVAFPLPPIEEQKRIVEAIIKMNSILDQIQNNLI